MIDPANGHCIKMIGLHHLTSTKPIDGKSLDFKAFTGYRLCLCIVNPIALTVLIGKQPQF